MQISVEQAIGGFIVRTNIEDGDDWINLTEVVTSLPKAVKAVKDFFEEPKVEIKDLDEVPF